MLRLAVAVAGGVSPSVTVTEKFVVPTWVGVPEIAQFGVCFLTQVPKGSGEDYDYYTQAYSYYAGSSEKGDRGSDQAGPGAAGPGPERLDLK